MFGPADRHESPVAAGPSGFLQKKVRDRDGILQEPGEAGRTLHGKDSEHQGPPTIQVSIYPPGSVWLGLILRIWAQS